MAKVSIIMGIYNCAATLPEAIDSILTQTFPDWQLVLCDDGSKDNTYTVAKAYQEKFPDKIVLLQNERNMGLNHTLNRCLQAATGEYVARMDGDDISLPPRLEKEVAFLDAHPEYAIVSTPMIFFDESGDWGRSYANLKIMKRSAWPTYRRWLRNLALLVLCGWLGSFLPEQYSGYVSLFAVAIAVSIFVMTLFLIVNTALEKGARATVLEYLKPVLMKLARR